MLAEEREKINPRVAAVSDGVDGDWVVGHRV
jgi:hypothetical protein